MGWAASWVARCAAYCVWLSIGQCIVLSHMMSSICAWLIGSICVGQHVAQHIMRDGLYVVLSGMMGGMICVARPVGQHVAQHIVMGCMLRVA